jgi:general secretion pathway protein N
VSRLRRGLAPFTLLLVFAGLLLVRLPAALLDAALARHTGGALRLADARGSLWQGSAMLAGPQQAGGTLQSWLPVEWTFAPQRLLRGEVAWALGSGGRAFGTIAAGAGGFRGDSLRLALPLQALAAAATHPLAHLGWRGRLGIAAPALHCGWRGRCTGALELDWRGAGSALLPAAALGRYRLQAHLADGDLNFRIDSPSGPLRLKGEGMLPFGGALAFRGTVEGEPALVGRLPTVLDGIAFAGEDPGRVDLVVE